MQSILVIVFFLATFHLQSQSCASLPGTWENELGSAMVIDRITNDGKIIGKYASSTGVDGKVFPLDGWVNTSEEFPDQVSISFSVKWTGYGSITSWTGYCAEEEKGPEIKTIWHLVRSGKEFNWERIITNSSTFLPEKSN